MEPNNLIESGVEAEPIRDVIVVTSSAFHSDINYSSVENGENNVSILLDSHVSNNINEILFCFGFIFIIVIYLPFITINIIFTILYGNECMISNSTNKIYTVKNYLIISTILESLNYCILSYCISKYQNYELEQIMKQNFIRKILYLYTLIYMEWYFVGLSIFINIDKEQCNYRLYGYILLYTIYKLCLSVYFMARQLCYD